MITCGKCLVNWLYYVTATSSYRITCMEFNSTVAYGESSHTGWRRLKAAWAMRLLIPDQGQSFLRHHSQHSTVNWKLLPNFDNLNHIGSEPQTKFQMKIYRSAACLTELDLIECNQCTYLLWIIILHSSGIGNESLYAFVGVEPRKWWGNISLSSIPYWNLRYLPDYPFFIKWNEQKLNLWKTNQSTSK